ncbi:Gfo/Idh/MocA family protein [Paenibacillus sp. FSL K6-2441]|uniref:Gfo/Idh/MocA family protein n=1 Tax=Paenibacillus TaxID=44249 RepID=UPI0030D6D05D
MTMQEPIGAAIIGCGAIFPLHAGAVQQLDGVKLKVVVDSDAAKAEQAAAAYSCEAASDYLTLLDRDDIQVVHLCTPHHLHAEMATQLLRAGKHVLTEKPLAHDLKAAENLVAEARRSEAQLGVVFQNRYNDSSRKIREFLESKTLGRLICLKGIVTWHRDEAYYTDSPWRGRWSTEGGGVLINQAIHTLDLLQWFGGEVLSVQGSVTADALGDVIEVEDTAHASLRFADGVHGLFYATNAYLTNTPVELELVFEGGTLRQRDDCLYLTRDGRESLVCEPPANLSDAGQIIGKSYWGSSHQLLIADFYDRVRTGTRFAIDGEEGLKTLRLIDELYQSSRTRKSR